MATEEEKIVIVAADAVQIDEILVATCIAIPTLCMLLLLVLVFGKKR